MGFDMRIENRIESVELAKQAARDQFEAACRERDALGAAGEGPDRANLKPASEAFDEAQKRVSAASEAMWEADAAYFRLNVWGMSRMVDDMITLGMLALNYPGYPDWPEYDEAYEERLDELGELSDAELAALPDEPAKAFEIAQREVKAWSPPDEPGIPAHKFGSNDGWLVTPLDIRGALEALKRADADLVAKVRAEWTDEDGGNNFDRWIEYLQRAQQHGGFRVW